MLDSQERALIGPMIECGVPPMHTLTPAETRRMYRAGIREQYLCFERQAHGFVTMSRVINEALTAVDLCAAALCRALTAHPAHA